jgi:cation diffusion facilitator family transporter
VAGDGIASRHHSLILMDGDRAVNAPRVCGWPRLTRFLRQRWAVGLLRHCRSAIVGAILAYAPNLRPVAGWRWPPRTIAMHSNHLTPTELAQRRRAALASVSVGIALLVVKFAAYFLTRSTAILSDALESIINVVASGFALFSITLSGRPPDDSHPYGHGKIEFFAAGFEGALIVAAAFGIAIVALRDLLHPPELLNLNLGIGLLALGGVVNFALGWYLIRSGRSSRSETLVADGHHVQSDAWTSFGVLVGLVLVKVTGWAWLDPAVAIVVAVNILVTGRRLIRESAAGLMDESDPEFLGKVADALEDVRKPGWIAPHHLRSRRTGAVRHTDFHMVLPRFWDLTTSHEVQEAIEPAIIEATGEPGQVLVHFDPCNRAYCAQCDLPDCPVRDDAFTSRSRWRVEDLVDNPPYPRVLGDDQSP